MSWASAFHVISKYPPKEPPVFKRLNFTEPAVLRGVITAVIALAASLGFVATDEIKGAAEGLIPVVAFLLPLLQSFWTRQAVYSPETVDDIAGKHAAPEL